jgi:hypothetical protein
MSAARACNTDIVNAGQQVVLAYNCGRQRRAARAAAAVRLRGVSKQLSSGKLCYRSSALSRARANVGDHTQ